MATISRFRAIAALGPIRASGFTGWLMWLFVHLMFLTGFKNRVAVLFNWLIAFIGRGRPQRAITAQQVFARQLLAAHPTPAAPRYPSAARHNRKMRPPGEALPGCRVPQLEQPARQNTH